MRAATLSDTGLLIEVDVQELRILAAVLTIVCNSGQVLDDLEDRFSGTKDKAETLLITLRSLNAIFDRLTDSPKSEAIANDCVSFQASDGEPIGRART